MRRGQLRIVAYAKARCASLIELWHKSLLRLSISKT